MDKETFLSDFAKKNLFLIDTIDDRIYECVSCKKNQKSDNYYEIQGVVRKFTKGPGLVQKENEFITGKLKKDGIDSLAQIKELCNSLNQKQKEIKNKKNDIALINFVNEFFAKMQPLCNGSLPQYEFPENIRFELKDLDQLELNDGSGPSILKQGICKENQLLLFMGKKCYTLIERDAKNMAEAVYFKGKKYASKYLCPISELDTKYYQKMIDTFFEKICASNVQSINQLKQLEKSHKALENELKQLKESTKEDALKEFGLMLKDGKYYLYVNVDSYPIEDYESNFVKYGYFPACKIGVRMMVEDGKYMYSFDDRIHPIILDHNYYEHPAVNNFNKPALCVRGGGFEYDPSMGRSWFNDSDKNKLMTILETLLIRARSAISNGYKPGAIIYHRFSDTKNDFFKKYKNLGVPK